MEVNGQLHAPAALTAGKDLRYPLDKELLGLRAGLDTVTDRKFPDPVRN